MKRRIFALLLALLMCAVTAVSASADAYIPPANVAYYDILSAHNYNGTCSALNTFLSNFVEINLQNYSQSSPDGTAIAAILKHVELNAASFSSDVKKVTQDDGSVYMRISGSLFERRMERLFGKDIPASACPGYEDGKILVSADHFGGPIQVFASVYDCSYYEDDLYRVYFDAYFVDVDFSGWYRTAHDNLPTNKITKLGSGIALVRYAGGQTESSISTADFTLAEISMSAEGIPCGGANVPFGVETQPAATEAEDTKTPETKPVEAVTEAQTEVPTQANPLPETEPETEPEESEREEVKNKKEFDKSDNWNISISPVTLVLIILLVVLLAVLALLIVVLFIRKRK